MDKIKTRPTTTIPLPAQRLRRLTAAQIAEMAELELSLSEAVPSRDLIDRAMAWLTETEDGQRLVSIATEAGLEALDLLLDILRAVVARRMGGDG